VLAARLHVPFADPEIELAIFGLRAAWFRGRLRAGLRRAWLILREDAERETESEEQRGAKMSSTRCKK
jgi:hypothetical protein